MTDSKVTVGNNVGGGGSGQGLGTPPSLVEFEGLRFLITEAPKNKNLHVFLKTFKKFNVTNIVRISEPLYSADAIEKAGIKLHEMHFPDGERPPDEIISEFLTLVDATFPEKGGGGGSTPPTIAVHCVAGLGRAPVMIAIALIEKGMDAMSAVQYIRLKRRGAINALQLSYLESYVPRSKPKGCVLM